MVSRNIHFYFIISENQSKFAASCELMILPAVKIAVNTHPWEPLCDGVKVISVFREILITASSAFLDTIRDVIVPIDFENEFFSFLQSFWKVNTHHCLVDHIFQ